MIRYRYANNLAPPAPFVNVTGANPATGAQARDCPAQIDTGEDRTVLPNTVVEALSLPQTGTLLVGGFGNTRHPLPTYTVLVNVHNLTPYAVTVVGSDEEEWILLGRDLANLHRFLLDGPGLALEIV